MTNHDYLLCSTTKKTYICLIWTRKLSKHPQTYWWKEHLVANDLDVSNNSGTPKLSILIRFSIINHPFRGTPIFGNTHIPFKVFKVQSFRIRRTSVLFGISSTEKAIASSPSKIKFNMMTHLSRFPRLVVVWLWVLIFHCVGMSLIGAWIGLLVGFLKFLDALLT